VRANSDESFIDNPILITGILPLLPGARSLSSAVFLAATLLIVSMALQVLSAILGRILNPWPWKTCMIFFASVFVSIMLKLTGILDRHAAMAIEDVVALFLFSGVMRIQYRAWSEDIGHGVYYQISRIIPAIAAALILVAFGALREILEAGRLTLPAFGGAQSVVSVPPFSMLPSSVLAMSAGAFLIAGYATVVLRLVGRRKRKEGRPS
jgi:hypothetical protein